MLLKGKTAIITGARTGIGKATVELMAQNGANIWASIKEPNSEFEKSISDLAKKHNVWIKVIYMDLSDEESIKCSAKEIINEKKKIDILINAAGTVGVNRHFHMTNISEMRRVFEINFFGSIALTQIISRVMCKQQSGVIVNVASVAGIDGDPAQLEYSASKAALINSTKKLASEFGTYGIRVNAVAPGLTDTKMLNEMVQVIEAKVIARSIIKRRADPIEIANVILFLASDMSSFITGQTIRADGGLMV